MSDAVFKTDEWSYDPTCKRSPTGAHHWIIKSGTEGRCKHCTKKQHFIMKTTNQPRAISRAYSIRGGQSSARRAK
jgi:hypothetical protein